MILRICLNSCFEIAAVVVSNWAMLREMLVFSLGFVGFFKPFLTGIPSGITCALL